MSVVRYTFFSEALREQVNVMVILPSFEGWRDRQGSKAYYGEYGRKKTLYIMHGGSDDCSLYLRRTRIEEYAMEHDLAVVMPEVKNSFYSNMVHGKNYFTYISEELPRVMESVFPLTHDPKERFVIGNSMGSHGAIKWALNCPGFFAAAAGMSGAGDLEELGFYDGKKDRVLNAFGTIEQYRGSMNDFKYMVNKHLEEGTKLPRLYFCCGKQDGFYKGAKLFADFVKEKGLETCFRESDGQHNWEYWDEWLPVMIRYCVKGEV